MAITPGEGGNNSKVEQANFNHLNCIRNRQFPPVPLGVAVARRLLVPSHTLDGQLVHVAHLTANLVAVAFSGRGCTTVDVQTIYWLCVLYLRVTWAAAVL